MLALLLPEDLDKILEIAVDDNLPRVYLLDHQVCHPSRRFRRLRHH